MEEETPNHKFLRALEKTRTTWESNRQFNRIFEKIAKGKNLNRDEFSRVYFMIRETSQQY